VVASAVLPHIIKRLVDQRRPDRCIQGRRNGIGKSGNANDAFPSGHALHVGAIAAAVSRQLPAARPTAWMIGVRLGGSRVLLFAHWASDVLAGLALGAGLEHIINQVWDRAPRGATSGEHPPCKIRGGAGARSRPSLSTEWSAFINAGPAALWIQRNRRLTKVNYGSR